MLDCYQQLDAGPYYQDSLLALQADVHHANALASSIPRGKGGVHFQMKLVYNHLAPILLFLLQWIDCSSVILPSLQRLHGDSSELETTQEEVHGLEMVVRKKLEDKKKISNVDLEREDECGICLEPCTKMVLPNCCHAMCINCYRDWNTRSESCPFCRGTLKRVDSGDLWVLTCSNDVVDTQTVLRDDILRFYLFINSLPKDNPDALFIMYYEYLF
uniref:RING-type domain-containing protein n=1 Tax=Fagus sylvatica TaxID=28930 RepID=A0A2N9EJZ7_FAGSY